MNILFDTNIILDVLQNRGEFAGDAVPLFNAVETSDLSGYICANSISTIAYLLQRQRNKSFASDQLKLLLNLFDIAPVNRGTIDQALSSGFTDFEDAIVYHSAQHINAQGIVTRNGKDFKKSGIAIYTPRELVAALGLKN